MSTKKDLIELDALKAVLPKGVNNTLSPDIVKQINDMLADPDSREMFRDNIFGYTHVLKEGKFKLSSYLDAVKYVGFKMMGCQNIEAYIKTFPDRYQNMLNKGYTRKDISAYVAGYHKNKLVQMIFTQAQIPVHLSHADIFHKAVLEQADLMSNAKSEKVRCDAANSLMNHLKPPEAKETTLNIGIKSDDVLVELAEAAKRLAIEQKRSLELGNCDLKDIAHSKVINGEYKEVD